MRSKSTHPPEILQVEFLPLLEKHRDLFLAWLSRPHIKENFSSLAKSEDLLAFFEHQLKAQWVEGFLFCQDTKPLGYIEIFDAYEGSQGFWPEAPMGTYGIDLFVADVEDQGKGLGTQVLKHFIDRITKDDKVKKLISDPFKSNQAAIRCFEKNGFEKKGDILTPQGTVTLMCLSPSGPTKYGSSQSVP